jgi:hypothetical protein
MKQISIYYPTASSKAVLEIQDSTNSNHIEIVPLDGNICRISSMRHRRSVNQPVHPTIESGYYILIELANGDTYKINLSEIELPVTVPVSVTGNWINSEAGAALAVREISSFASQIVSSVSSGSSFDYEIGQYVAAEGGVIAHRWLSTSSLGSPTSGTIQNYLVVDTANLSTSASWASSNVNISNVESTWDGTTNTANLIAAGAGGGITAGTAAVLCNNSTNNSKSDWYLPAVDELSKIWQNRWDISQGITTASGTQLAFDNYWSSTEKDTAFAWFFYFYYGFAEYGNKNLTYYVRAVRKFSI